MRWIRGVKTKNRSTVTTELEVNLWLGSTLLHEATGGIRMSNIAGVRGTWVSDDQYLWLRMKSSKSTDNNEYWQNNMYDK